MCVPKVKTPKTEPLAPPASAIPSIAAATNFASGAQDAFSPRGAAGLGRLKLRIGGGASTNTRKTTSGAPTQAPTGDVTSAAYLTPNAPPAGGDYPGGFAFRGFDRINAL